MRRQLATIAVALAALAALTATAAAHPLGNFSVNHVTTVQISDGRVELRYVLDQAEIPTLQERGGSRAELLRDKRAEILRGLELNVDGRPAPLALAAPPRLSFPPGAGGLRTTRLELDLRAAVETPRRVALHDGTFAGRLGWKAVVAAPGEGTAVRTGTPSGDPTDGLRRYPDDLLSSPADRRDARFAVRPGDGTLTAPASEGAPVATTRAGDVAAPNGEGAAAASAHESDGFAGLFEDAAAGRGVLLLLLATAFGWGALHALSPGHGKAMVAAYLVGTRGSARDAVALGATVTVTHTIGVFALGLVTLALSQYVLPEDLYPWLTLVSGLLVLSVGAAVLRSRLRHARRGHAHGHDRAHSHDHGHAHHDHAHGHGHGHTHDHGHTDDLGWRGIVGVGAAAGLIPCPSALVVLLAAISQHEVALGLLLIVAFSLGLSATLTGLGVAVVSARRLVPAHASALAGGRLATAVPAASALLIVAVGCVLTAKALPGVT